MNTITYILFLLVTLLEKSTSSIDQTHTKQDTIPLFETNISHLDSLLCLYATEGYLLLQEVSEEEKREIEEEYKTKAKNNTIPYEITGIEKSLTEIENYFICQQKSGFFKKIIRHVSVPPYIKNFLSQVKQTEGKNQNITKKSLETYFSYIRFFLKYSSIKKKSIFATNTFNTLPLLLEGEKSTSYKAGYPKFNYKKIYKDLALAPSPYTFYYNKITKYTLGFLALYYAYKFLANKKLFTPSFEINPSKKEVHIHLRDLFVTDKKQIETALEKMKKDSVKKLSKIQEEILEDPTYRRFTDDAGHEITIKKEKYANIVTTNVSREVVELLAGSLKQ
jgi:hypothetical protein